MLALCLIPLTGAAAAVAVTHSGRWLPRTPKVGEYLAPRASRADLLEPTPAPLSNERYGLLLCGIDNTNMLADVILYAQLDLKTQSARLLQIPRDLFVGEQVPTGKINAACLPFSSANPASQIAQIVERQLALPIDGTLSVTLAGIRSIIDAAGGIPIDLPRAIDYLPGKTLPQGPQVLDGERAEWLLRYRQGYENADLGRLEAQQLFLSAAMDTARGLGRLEALRIAAGHFGHIKTTLPLAEALSLVQSALEIAPEKIEMHLLPTWGEYYGSYAVLCADRYRVAELLNAGFLAHDPVSPWDLQLAYPPAQEAPPSAQDDEPSGMFDFSWDFDDYPELDEREGLVIRQ